MSIVRQVNGMFVECITCSSKQVQAVSIGDITGAEELACLQRLFLKLSLVMVGGEVDKYLCYLIFPINLLIARPPSFFIAAMMKRLILATAALVATSNASDSDSSSRLVIHVRHGASRIG
jgi:hypothetical protein